MKSWAMDLRQSTKLTWNGLYRFKQKIEINIESGSYHLKTASERSELIESFKLRHEVFFCDELVGIDVDKYDSLFDHLIIVHKETKKVIGTYRINCVDLSGLTYTESEFKIDDLLAFSGPHLELGRACIHSEHRRGAVLSLLWRGICEYVNLSEANIIFGCSSVMTMDSEKAALIYKYFAETGAVSKEFSIFPKRRYQIPDFDIWMAYFNKQLTEAQQIYAQELIPPLLKSYLKNGAKIASLPALDKDFGCIDFLTVLKKVDMTNSFSRRFQVIQ